MKNKTDQPQTEKRENKKTTKQKKKDKKCQVEFKIKVERNVVIEI